jgi:choline dehydrogenase-like flavoprotein
VGVRDVTGSVPLSAGPGRRVVAIVLGAVGEGLAIPGNEVVLHPGGRADPYGNSVPLVRFRWDERHLEFGRKMQSALGELLGRLSCDVLAVTGGEEGPGAAPTVGGYGHEVGTARMGTEEYDSVVSPRCQVHGVENLFVVDGSVFPSYPDKNPTLTILANCARVCDWLAGTM